MYHSTTELATFAGGCFWCMVSPFDQLPGIKQILSGYTGGTTPYPSYEAVCSGVTGHTEAVQITFDPQQICYSQLLEIYWQQTDPTDALGQFADRGSSYRPVIFYHSQEQYTLATHSKQQLIQSKRFSEPIITQILPASPFYLAEEYHQNFYKKSPLRYKNSTIASGRDAFIQQHWKNNMNKLKNSQHNLEQLTELQRQVTQHNATEPPFNNLYWDNKQAGIYIDIISGEPLFCSLDQYDAGCGWPSFTQPINPQEITEHLDLSHNKKRIEVRSKTANSHLGHVFSDGILPEKRLRYCINSAALKFIPVEELEQQGYAKYLTLFL